jgi:hypothetical protein
LELPFLVVCAWVLLQAAPSHRTKATPDPKRKQIFLWALQPEKRGHSSNSEDGPSLLPFLLSIVLGNNRLSGGPSVHYPVTLSYTITACFEVEKHMCLPVLLLRI